MLIFNELFRVNAYCHSVAIAVGAAVICFDGKWSVALGAIEILN